MQVKAPQLDVVAQLDLASVSQPVVVGQADVSGGAVGAVVPQALRQAGTVVAVMTIAEACDAWRVGQVSLRQHTDGLKQSIVAISCRVIELPAGNDVAQQIMLQPTYKPIVDEVEITLATTVCRWNPNTMIPLPSGKAVVVGSYVLARFRDDRDRDPRPTDSMYAGVIVKVDDRGTSTAHRACDACDNAA